MVKDENESVMSDGKSICKAFVAGGVAGMCAKTTVAPLDRIKILLQAHNKHYKHHGVFSGLLNIVRQERFLALYKGNGAQMVRVFPYAATQFTSFEIYKQTFRSLLGPNSHVGTFASGSMAGVTAVFFTYPLDTIRARLAFQVAGEHKYNGILHVATSIVREEGGPRALYRGFAATLCGMIPYAGLSFYIFERMKYTCMKYLPRYTCHPCEQNTGGLVLSVPAKLLCGGMAGAAAQSVSYPFDVTRRRMQLAYMSPETRKFGMGMVQTLRIIHRENGVVRGLYRGMSINYMRAIPMVAVSFSTYELMKQTLHLDTGIKIKVG
ncbi:graves disease carrier protein homolog isoform X2 [Pollicipes pollicipes]|uniref:graves disease carrier protein homolog isoform X2 n=1 Tax=Pollicipes pollicipes TaxID=41117 RepID=UPI001884A871|nr:graves disease carrier protein homolog isoform X2 [Pollicipes pollicipes]